MLHVPEQVMAMGGPAHGQWFYPHRYVAKALLAWPDGFYEFVYALTEYVRKDGSHHWIFRPKDNVVRNF